MKPTTPMIALLLLLAPACSGDGAAPSPPSNQPEGGVVDAGGDSGQTFTGGACPDVGLPPTAAAMVNVVASARGANVNVTYDLVDGAKDYRVYVLPAKSDVSPTGSIQNGLYRCGGLREAPEPLIDDSTTGQFGRNVYSRTRVVSTVDNYARTLDAATLGYVFTSPGDGRVPVYAMGDPGKDADTDCQVEQYTESRVKVYTTSESERQTMLSARWRDDGVAFYVPSTSTGTHGVSSIQPSGGPTLYVADGAEADKRKAGGAQLTAAFNVLASATSGAVPLMRVFYANVCGRSHDELVPGKARFERAWHQGLQPVDALHWSGLTGKTTLVVEALDDLCPYPGTISPIHRPAQTISGIYPTTFEAWPTLDEARAASPTGEVFIGGEGRGTHPNVVARSCVVVEPAAPQDLDFSFTGMTAETFGPSASSGFQSWSLSSPNFDVEMNTTETNEWAIGNMLGELWLPHADWAADTNGKVRITPKTKASLADASFTHVTLETDSFATHRRYPQILISENVDWPVQANLPKGSTVIVQPIHTWPTALEVQVCDHRTWDVNNQCPKYDLFHLTSNGKTFLAPNASIADRGSVDRTNVFDVYVSTGRVYTFFNGAPYGCADLPKGVMPSGPATVTFGDVLYHSGADLEVWDTIHLDQLHYLSSRHFSNFGFKSGLGAPAWDENRLPCVAANKLAP